MALQNITFGITLIIGTTISILVILCFLATEYFAAHQWMSVKMKIGFGSRAEKNGNIQNSRYANLNTDNIENPVSLSTYALHYQYYSSTKNYTPLNRTKPEIYLTLKIENEPLEAPKEKEIL